MGWKFGAVTLKSIQMPATGQSSRCEAAWGHALPVLWKSCLILLLLGFSHPAHGQISKFFEPFKAKAADAQGKATELKGKAEEGKGKLEEAKGKLGAAEKSSETASEATTSATSKAAQDSGLNLPERSIHAIELEKYMAVRNPSMNTDQVWSRFSRTTIHPARYQNDRLGGVREVYGFHPFWMGDAWKSYNFELVNHVGYYAYPVNPRTGDSRGDMNQWLTTGMVQEAHKYHCKVDLVAALYGEANTTAFLDNKKAQERLISNLIDLLYARGDGITLDFQEVPASRKSQFSAFVIYLYERLKLANPAYELRVTLPLLDREGAFELDKYARIVTAFIVTGYDCYGAKNGKPGPSSVLSSADQWRKPDLHMSVETYLSSGVDTHQLVLSLPHFGKEWQVTTNDRGVAVAAVDAIRPYNFFLQPLEGQARFDSASSSAYRIGTGIFVTRYYWWDDVPSLTQKYDFVKAQGLRGIGIWALGYDNGREEMWDLLREKFAAKDTTIKKDTLPPTPRGRPYDPITRATVGDFRWIGQDTFPLPAAFHNAPGDVEGDFLLMYGNFDISITRDMGLLANWLLLILLVFVELGFWIGLLQSEIRDVVFVKRRPLAYVLLFVSTAIPLLIMRSFGIHVGTEWVLVLLLGSLLAASLISARMVTLYHRPKP